MRVGVRTAVAISSALTLSIAYGYLRGSATVERATPPAPHVHASSHGMHATNGGGPASVTPQAENRLPIAIDGSREPGRIPDRLAYFHLIRALSQPATPTKQETARRNALLNPIGLAPADRAALVAALSGVREGLDRVAVARRGLKSEALVEVSAQITAATLKREEDTLLGDAFTRLTTTLSADGVNRLQFHVRNHVKQRIVIYGDARGLDFAFN
jgi:hypothetical protein